MSMLNSPPLHIILLRYLKRKPHHGLVCLGFIQIIFIITKLFALSPGIGASLIWIIIASYPLLYLLLRPYPSIVTKIFFRGSALVALYLLPTFAINLFTSRLSAVSYFSLFQGLLPGNTQDPAALLTLLAIIVAIFVITSTILIHLNHYYFSFIITAFPAALAVLNLHGEENYTITSMLIMTLFALLALTINSSKRNITGNHSIQHITITFIAIFLPVIILTRLFSQAGTSNIFEDIYQRLEYRHRVNFSQATAGFSENETDLGGPVKPEDSIEMIITGKRTVKLRGAVKISYTGTRWNRPVFRWEAPTQPSRNTETVSDNPAFTKEELLITPVESANALFFTPLFTESVEYKDDVLINKEALYIPEPQENVTSQYQVFYYHNTTDLLEQFTYSKNSEERKLRDIRLRYRDYLQIPGSVTKRTRKMALSITEQANNHKEITDAIGSFLYSNYSYELNASHLPPDRDFVDFFLFTERRGYCTHFATAAAMLLRINGIPTRYVEGFQVDDLKDENGRFIVKSAMAHVWCEVLIDPENNIWAPFDPTPSTFYRPADESYWRHFVYDYLLRTGDNDEAIQDELLSDSKQKTLLTAPEEPSLVRWLELIYLIIPGLLLYALSRLALNFGSIVLKKEPVNLYYYTITVLKYTEILSPQKNETPFEQIQKITGKKESKAALAQAALPIIDAYYQYHFNRTKPAFSPIHSFLILTLAHIRVAGCEAFGQILSSLYYSNRQS
jgi:transglutaminase-like putative cysteine protease